MADQDQNRSMPQITQDPEVIKKWAEKRGGRPAIIKNTSGGDDIGMLRIDFKDKGDDESDVEEISWDDFFAKMKERNLAFLYEDRTADGQMSRFSKLVYADRNQGGQGIRDGGGDGERLE